MSTGFVVARNYAEALAEVAGKGGAGTLERFGAVLDAVAGAIESSDKLKAVLFSPRITKTAKRDVVVKALHGEAPAVFVRWLSAVVARDRQVLLPAISAAYRELVDVRLNRVHAGVVTAHEVDAALGKVIAERLEAAVGKTVVPHYRTDPALIGGIVVRIGDRVFDGSLRRRLRLLRHRMLHAHHGTEAAASE